MNKRPLNLALETSEVPQPMTDGVGATDPGPRNILLDLQNPDLLTPPRTDAGTIPNMKFSFSNAHNRLCEGGWAREVTAREMPVSITMAGVNMRLTPGGVREMHWHKESEWAIMLNGRARLTSVDQEGRNFIEDVSEGDLWFFPAGIPHSIQGLKEGCEFLLVFNNGNFSENETFLISGWFAHTPKEILAKNFGVAVSNFASLPTQERYIFQSQVPGELSADRVSDPNGTVPQSFVYRLMEQEPIRSRGGSVRIVDSTNFPISTTTAAALVEIEPGGLRELHWHPNNDEWQYYIEGQGRMTVFASGGKARTFDYQAGDVGYVPFAMGHYIENTGDTPLRFLEMFRSERFADVSLNQWMALTTPALVQDHLHLNQTVIDALHKQKQPVVI